MTRASSFLGAILATAFFLLGAADVAQAQATQQRFALIVGVKDYRPEPYEAKPNEPIRLKNLNTPCDDAARLALALSKLGWRDEFDAKPEIKTVCDPDAGTLKMELGKLTDFLTGTKKSFGILYFAGHGVEINQRNYLFAKQASLNMANAAQSLGGDGGRVLFRGEAAEINEDIGRSLGGDGCDCDFLVILDACRDDPMAYQAIEKATGWKLSAPQVDGIPKGMMVYYATTPGKRVAETTSSALADAFSDYWSDDVKNKTYRSVLKTLSEVRDIVADKTKLTPFKQIPEPKGLINDTDRCFGPCKTLAQAPSLGPVKENALLWRVRFVRRSDQAISSPPPDPSTDEENVPPLMRVIHDDRSQTTRLAETADVRGVTLDVFWCADEPRWDRFNYAVDRAKQLIGIEVEIGGARSRADLIRVRRFQEDLNERPEYRVNQNVIKITSGSEQQAAVAQIIRQRLDRAVGIQRERGGIFDNLSVYICKGATTPEAATRVWFHVPTDEQTGFGGLLGQAVKRERSEFNVEPLIKVIAESPDQSQVRYFFPTDETAAEDVLRILGAQGHVEARIHYLPKYPDAKPGLVEVWLGKNEGNLEERRMALAASLQ